MLRFLASNLTSSVSKNVHFPAGKSIFFVSNALAHFRLSPLVPSKTFTFLQENQYFTFPCFQPTVFIHPSSFWPLPKTFIFLQENQYFAPPCIQLNIFCVQKCTFSCKKTNIFRFQCILSPLVPTKTFIFQWKINILRSDASNQPSSSIQAAFGP